MNRFLFSALVLPLLVGAATALDREAFSITRYQLDVQIDRPSHVMAVTGKITLRNDSKLPQKNPVLQISSSLTWNGVAFDNKPTEWIEDDYTSDIDHTGGLSEVVVTLPKAVPPGESVLLDVQYGGTITADATRFTRMGAPAQLALRSDWDVISESFTAVRGFGHVVWYPVSLSAVSMSEGDTVFAAINDWKLRHRGSQFDADLHVIGDDVKLCIVGTAMTSPCAVIDQAPDPRTDTTTSRVSNSIHLTKLGDITPSFAVAEYQRLERPDITIVHTPDNLSVAKDFAAVAETNESVLDDWLPPSAVKPVVIELSNPDANPYQDGALLFAPLRMSDSATLNMLLIPAQTAARFPSPRLWIEDGMQRFMQALSVERRSDRKAALQFLNEYLPPLVTTEEANAANAGDSARHSLIRTSDDVLLRGKGAFVFLMLRDMLGDATLQKAIAAYRPQADTSPAYLQGLLEGDHKHDLEWFFDDWVYRDRGLPNFRVETVYPRPLLEDPNQLSLVTVTVENRGGAGAEVPVFIQTANGERTVRVLVPAHQKASARSQIPASPTKVIVNDGSVPVSDSKDSTYDVPATPAQP